MTAIVGILCSDGVVVASDSSATFTASAALTIEQRTKKVEIVADTIIIAGTGQVGLNQRFVGIVAELEKKKAFTQHYLNVGVILARHAIDDFVKTNVAANSYGSLLAYTYKGEFRLCEFATRDFQPEFKTEKMWFVSMGSGQPITDPFLGFIRRVFWNDDKLPCVADALFFAYWTLEHVIHLNPGGINGPIQMAAIRKGPSGTFKAEFISDDELTEHESNRRAIEHHLRQYKLQMQGEGGQPIPSIT